MSTLEELIHTKILVVPILKILTEIYVNCEIVYSKIYSEKYRFTIFFENNMLYQILMYDDHIELQWIYRAHSNISTSEYIKKSILFAQKIPEIYCIVIGGDDSKLVFQNNDWYTSVNLPLLNLFAYGKTWYNRLGFGKQSLEWEKFINTPFLKLLENTNYNGIQKFSEYFSCTISNTFINIISKLKKITTKNLNGYLNNIENSDKKFVEQISELLYFLKLHEYLPCINYNSTYYL